MKYKIWNQNDKDVVKMITYIRNSITNSNIDSFKNNGYGISFSTILKVPNYNMQTNFAWQFDYDGKDFASLPRFISERIEKWKTN